MSAGVPGLHLSPSGPAEFTSGLNSTLGLRPRPGDRPISIDVFAKLHERLAHLAELGVPNL